MRRIAAPRASSEILPRATWRSRLRSISWRARASAAWSTSLSFTSSPASAQTCAMPLPIWPAPMIPMFWIMPFDPSLALGELGVELGHQLEEIADEAVIGDLEDRRLLVLVNGDDDLRVLHPGE